MNFICVKIELMLKTKRKILFICSQNRWRSLTAEVIFRNHPQIEARSAGTSSNARHQVSVKDLTWADLILCMEERHAEIIKVLDIPSGYRYMDEELIKLLRQQIQLSLF